MHTFLAGIEDRRGEGDVVEGEREKRGNLQCRQQERRHHYSSFSAVTEKKRDKTFEKLLKLCPTPAHKCHYVM